MKHISLVSTVYHTAASLPDMLAEFQRLAERNTGETFEFIFVDDGSKDNSYEVLLQLRGQDPRVKIVKLSRNFGAIPAALAGMSMATGDVVGAIASDLQDPPALFHEMLEHWRSGKKVVIAARAERDDPFLTSLFSDLFYFLFRQFAIKTMPEHGFDFFLIDRAVCNLVVGMQENNAYLMGTILWVGFDPVVVHYARRRREKKYGTSMWTLSKRFKYFVDSFAAFSYFPIRLASMLGILFSAIGLCYATFVIMARLAYAIRVEGWTSLMVVLLIVSGIQMLILGILGEYMWRNLDQTRHRPTYIIDQILGADPDEPSPRS